MRLFISINFSEEIKDSLCEAIATLRSACTRGNWTKRANLHLTLAFVGESSNVNGILDVMEEAAADLGVESIPIRLDQAGFFKGRDGDTHWIGVTRSKEMSRLASELVSKLSSLGVRVDKKRFTPHITIGRQVIVGEEGVQVFVNPASMQAKFMSLMRSDRDSSGVTYTEIERVWFSPDAEGEVDGNERHDMNDLND